MFTEVLVCLAGNHGNNKSQDKIWVLSMPPRHFNIWAWFSSILNWKLVDKWNVIFSNWWIVNCFYQTFSDYENVVNVENVMDVAQPKYVYDFQKRLKMRFLLCICDRTLLKMSPIGRSFQKIISLWFFFSFCENTVLIAFFP